MRAAHSGQERENPAAAEAAGSASGSGSSVICGVGWVGASVVVGNGAVVGRLCVWVPSTLPCVGGGGVGMTALPEGVPLPEALPVVMGGGGAFTGIVSDGGPLVEYTLLPLSPEDAAGMVMSYEKVAVVEVAPPPQATALSVVSDERGRGDAYRDVMPHSGSVPSVV